MRALRRLLVRLRNTISTRRHEARLQAEIDDHLERQASEYLQAGLSHDEARRQAILRFGAIEGTKETYRAGQALMPLQDFCRDVRYGVTSMRRSPGFTAVAVLTLALGIGGNTTIYSAINGILVERQPYADASRLMTIRRAQSAWGITPGERRAIQEYCPAFERLAAVDIERPVLSTSNGRTMRRWTARVSGDFFPMLDVPPLIGRPLVPEDAEPGRAAVAVLSYHLWRDGFNSDPNVVGAEVLINQARYSVVGVMPRAFELGVNLWGEPEEGVWVPLVDSSAEHRSSLVLGRVRRDMPLAAAEAQVAAVSARLPDRFPPDAEGTALVADRPGRQIDANVRYGLRILQGAVALVLLIASVNLSALLISRGWSRERELSIRKALGASRSRLIRQLLTESLLLALAAGTVGVIFSWWGIQALRAIAPPGTPRLDLVQLDGSVLAFTLGISVLSAVAFGLLPALQAATRQVRGGGERLHQSTFSRAVGKQRQILHKGLLLAEIGLAAVLVIGAALMVRSFDKLMRVDAGVESAGVMTMEVELSETACRPTCEATSERLLSALPTTPGVQRMAFSFGGPLVGGFYRLQGLLLDGSSTPQPFDGPERRVTPGYFGTAGIRLLAGREFDHGDHANVAIVSDAFARAYLGQSPVGRRFSAHRNAGGPVWYEVIGVVADVRDRRITGPAFAGPPYYLPFGWSNRWQIMARTSGGPAAIGPAMEGIVRSIDRAAIITNVKTLDQVLAESAALPRFQTSIFGLFGVLALVLAVVGVYGVTSYGVVQRTHEIGVRTALGARPSDVLRSVVGPGAVLAFGGIALGVASALALSGYLRSMLFEVQPVDGWSFAGAAGLLFVAALAACYLPARRAMRVNPVTALRHD